MFFTKEILSKLAEDELELVHKYSDSYAEMKANVDKSAEYDVVWAEGIAEPYYIGYINDIEKIPSRKIFAREPKRKIYAAKHYFKDKEPVYSVFMDDKGEPASEKFFFEQNGLRLGILFCGSRLKGISSEFFDNEGKPVCYRYTEIKKDIGTPEQLICKCFVYVYEDKHIISAQCIDSFDLLKKITMYDDPIYKDWKKQSTEYMMSVPPMNPNIVSEYKFIYEGNGYPSEFSRTEYRYCNVGTNQWKAPKKTFEQLHKLSIDRFVK